MKTTVGIHSDWVPISDKQSRIQRLMNQITRDSAIELLVKFKSKSGFAFVSFALEAEYQ